MNGNVSDQQDKSKAYTAHVESILTFAEKMGDKRASAALLSMGALTIVGTLATALLNFPFLNKIDFNDLALLLSCGVLMLLAGAAVALYVFQIQQAASALAQAGLNEVQNKIIEAQTRSNPPPAQIFAP